MTPIIIDSYNVPKAFFPAASSLPVISTPPGTIFKKIQQCISIADAVSDQLENQIQTLSQIHKALVPLSHALDMLVHLSTPAFQMLNRSDAHEEARQIAAADMSPVMAEACTIYDDYFRVVRVYSMNQLQFIGQVAHTSLNILCDLPHTLLDRMQIITLIQTIRHMFDVLAPGFELSVDGIHTDSGGDIGAQQSASQGMATYADVWQSDIVQMAGWTEQLSHYRWKVGHHFFNLCTMFCRHALIQAQNFVASQKIAEGVQQLGYAERFLRGTTAAMWYAGDFSANTYKEIIRPSMVMPGAPAGFSGDQNADYNRMKDAKKELKDLLRTNYEFDLSALPAELWHALMAFHEADIQDVEHHVLIAANKVGVDQSLAQKEWLAELPEMTHAQAAVDILREMADMRRQEFLD